MDEKFVGRNIFLCRKRKRMTLEQVANLSGLTRSYLSKIERSPKAPPFSTLGKIASALGVPTAALLNPARDKSEDPRICFTKKDDGESLETPSAGYRFRALSYAKPGKNMLPFIVEAAPEETAIFQHEGEEFIYVIEGTHEFTYDGTTFLMEQGDSVYYDAGVPHTGRSLGAKRAKLLIMVYNYRRT